VRGGDLSEVWSPPPNNVFENNAPLEMRK